MSLRHMMLAFKGGGASIYINQLIKTCITKTRGMVCDVLVFFYFYQQNWLKWVYLMTFELTPFFLIMFGLIMQIIVQSFRKSVP